MRNISDRISAVNGVVNVEYDFKDGANFNDIFVTIESNEDVREIYNKMHAIINEYN